MLTCSRTASHLASRPCTPPGGPRTRTEYRGKGSGAHPECASCAARKAKGKWRPVSRQRRKTNACAAPNQLRGLPASRRPTRVQRCRAGAANSAGTSPGAGCAAARARARCVVLPSAGATAPTFPSATRSERRRKRGGGMEGGERVERASARCSESHGAGSARGVLLRPAAARYGRRVRGRRDASQRGQPADGGDWHLPDSALVWGICARQLPHRIICQYFVRCCVAPVVGSSACGKVSKDIADVHVCCCGVQGGSSNTLHIQETTFCSSMIPGCDPARPGIPTALQACVPVAVKCTPTTQGCRIATHVTRI
eukprot:93608-Chlamydomonas_euryale.AAC.2